VPLSELLIIILHIPPPRVSFNLCSFTKPTVIHASLVDPPRDIMIFQASRVSDISINKILSLSCQQVTANSYTRQRTNIYCTTICRIVSEPLYHVTVTTFFCPNFRQTNSCYSHHSFFNIRSLNRNQLWISFNHFPGLWEILIALKHLSRHLFTDILTNYIMILNFNYVLLFCKWRHSQSGCRRPRARYIVIASAGYWRFEVWSVNLLIGPYREQSQRLPGYAQNDDDYCIGLPVLWNNHFFAIRTLRIHRW